MAFEKLMSPIKLGNVEIRNRVVMAPMAVGMAVGVNKINDTFVNYFGARAKGGTGLITTAFTGVDVELCGIPEPGAFTIVDRNDLDGIKRMCDVVHCYGGKISFQLGHPGRQSMSLWNDGQQPVAPSAIPENDGLEMPRALEVEEIKGLVKKFVNATELAIEGGADGIEIHAAHGYLIHEFLSPRANKRTDEYGGSFENRMRFLTEIINAVKKVIPEDRFLTVRLNAKDFTDGGFTPEECIEIAKYVESLGVDAINVSAGTYSARDALMEAQNAPEGCREELIRGFKNALKVPLIAVNHVKEPTLAERMLEEDLCDMVALGRPLIADPEWVNKTASGNADKIRYCIGCGACYANFPALCSVNPCVSKEGQYDESKLKRDGDGRQVVVIGGGPGGMEAATLAAKRGFNVTLFEKERRLGGAIDMPRAVTALQKIGRSVDAYISRTVAAGVDIRTGTEIKDASQITELNPYAVIIATGGLPIVPKSIKGIDLPKVKTVFAVYRDPRHYTGKKVAVIGSGLTGLEVAEVLDDNGNKVELFEMDEVLGRTCTGPNAEKNRDAMIRELQSRNVPLNTCTQLMEVTEKGAIFKDVATGAESEKEFDLVVLSLGFAPNKKAEEMLKGKVEKLYTIGDCVEDGFVLQATAGAYETVWNL